MRTTRPGPAGVLHSDVPQSGERDSRHIDTSLRLSRLLARHGLRQALKVLKLEKCQGTENVVPK
eukprot:2786895-Rhodomonas_salina.1